MAALTIRQKDGTLYSGARYVAHRASCLASLVTFWVMRGEKISWGGVSYGVGGDDTGGCDGTLWGVTLEWVMSWQLFSSQNCMRLEMKCFRIEH